MMKPFYVTIFLVLTIIGFSACSPDKNPSNPPNEEPAPFAVKGMADTIAVLYDSIQLHVTAAGNIAKIIWAVDGRTFADTTTDSILGFQLNSYFSMILVKGIDSANTETAVDTIFVSTIDISGPFDNDTVLSRGMSFERTGDYQTALKYYTIGTIVAPRISDCWYLKIKMTLRINNIRLPDLIGEIINESDSTLPFFPKNSNYSKATTDSLFNRLASLIKPLHLVMDDAIYLNSGYAPDGTYTRDKLLPDLTMLLMLNLSFQVIDQLPQDTALDSSSISPYNEKALYLYYVQHSTENLPLDYDTVGLMLFFKDSITLHKHFDNIKNAAQMALTAVQDWDDEIQASSAENIDKEMLKGPITLLTNIISCSN